MKKHLIVFIALSFVGLAGSAIGANLEFHGDLNHRFMIYSNPSEWFTFDRKGQTWDAEEETSWSEVKYRLWFESTTNDDRIKDVYAVEIGAVRYGRSGSDKSQGGSFSGNSVNIKTRWVYSDFDISDTQRRFKTSLTEFSVNGLFWNETLMGIFHRRGDLNLSGGRDREDVLKESKEWGKEDLDALISLYGMGYDNSRLGILGTYKAETFSKKLADFSSFNFIARYKMGALPEADLNMVDIGVDGSYLFPVGFAKTFLAWDVIDENDHLNNVSNDNCVTKEDVDI